MADEKIESLEKQLIEKKEIIRKSTGERDEIKSKIKLEKTKMKRTKRNGNGGNVLIRVSSEFDSALLDIQGDRVEIADDKTLASKPSLTNLICKHKLWNIIKKDLINFEFNNT